METCSIEVGLLRKKPCAHAAVAHCLNCEQPLCVSHAVAQLTEAGNKSGKFMCHECEVARKEAAKTQKAATAAKLMHQAHQAAAAPKAQPVHKPAPPPQPAAATATAAPPDSGALEFTPKDSGALEFTPSTPKKD